MNIHFKAILGALSFSFLFYANSLGLNTILISIVVVLFLQTVAQKNKAAVIYPITYVFTAVMVFLDPTYLKIFIHFTAFLLYVGKSISAKSPAYLSWAIGAINMIIASISHLNTRIASPEKETTSMAKKTKDYIKGGVLAFILLIVFTMLYKTANPVFNDLILKIDFSFISIPWLFFTILGYFIFLHLLRPYYPKELIALEQNQPDLVIPSSTSFSIPTLEKLRSEQTLGSIVLLALNALLLVFLVTDVMYLFTEKPLNNAAYSQSVHQGVYALMFSIVCAIGIILYFFRGDLNFYKGNKQIKKLAFAWIVLNTILVLFTAYKNYTYIQNLGFTYKRIGVYVYLLLTTIGLITACIKIARVKSFSYLFKMNLAAVFTVLFISAIVPWDNAITWYNLNYVKTPDLSYLLRLGDTNTSLLYEYSKNTTSQFDTEINTKYADFIDQQKSKVWQEYTLYNLTHNTTK